MCGYKEEAGLVEYPNGSSRRENFRAKSLGVTGEGTLLQMTQTISASVVRQVQVENTQQLTDG